MMNKTKKAVLITSGIVGFAYLGLMSSASNGYGYMGYRGYSSGPSFFYFGGPRTYYGQNVRSGSVSGSRFRGGGPSYGK